LKEDLLMPTNIEWTNETWNPVTGCTKISTGCRNCYAERMARRLAGRCGYPEAPNHFDITLHKDRLYQPLKWRKPRIIFVCSMGDLFHEDVPADYIVNIFEVMSAAKQHTFQVLTKRPQRMLDVLYGKEGNYYLGGGDFIPNIWLGVTTENQDTANERIPLLLQTDAFVHFVSVEPMLGEIDLRYWLPKHEKFLNLPEFIPEVIDLLDWVICGGETGPGAREMKAEWAQDLCRQCLDADVPFFFKKPGNGFTGNTDELPAVREWPDV